MVAHRVARFTIQGAMNRSRDHFLLCLLLRLSLLILFFLHFSLMAINNTIKFNISLFMQSLLLELSYQTDSRYLHAALVEVPLILTLTPNDGETDFLDYGAANINFVKQLKVPFGINDIFGLGLEKGDVQLVTLVCFGWFVEGDVGEFLLPDQSAADGTANQVIHDLFQSFHLQIKHTGVGGVGLYREYPHSLYRQTLLFQPQPLQDCFPAGQVFDGPQTEHQESHVECFQLDKGIKVARIYLCFDEIGICFLAEIPDWDVHEMSETFLAQRRADGRWRDHYFLPYFFLFFFLLNWRRDGVARLACSLACGLVGLQFELQIALQIRRVDIVDLVELIDLFWLVECVGRCHNFPLWQEIFLDRREIKLRDYEYFVPDTLGVHHDQVIHQIQKILRV